MLNYVSQHKELIDVYLDYRADKISTEEIKTYSKKHIENNTEDLKAIISKDFKWHIDIFFSELYINLSRKLVRMKKIEQEKGQMPDGDIYDNVETAFMSALYMYFRKLYNDRSLLSNEAELATALFVYIRNYSYSGMFRYNDDGEFNVPYGGIAYNTKSLRKKINYYKSETLLEHFANTTIENLDFEEFFKKHKPKENDFIFLDPPYDSEFSTYAQNEFTRIDQERLANYLCNECKGKWMMVIKYTPFIYSLYDKKNLHISTFDKTYLVSFMNRNDKNAEHLIIMNY